MIPYRGSPFVASETIDNNSKCLLFLDEYTKDIATIIWIWNDYTTDYTRTITVKYKVFVCTLNLMHRILLLTKNVNFI